MVPSEATPRASWHILHHESRVHTGALPTCLAFFGDRQLCCALFGIRASEGAIAAFSCSRWWMALVQPSPFPHVVDPKWQAQQTRIRLDLCVFFQNVGRLGAVLCM